ncbi:hypothetical protein CLW00_11292 [Mongoliibacter ruber]|uniref:Uncharacterized protein n=1 Tax=Mongoliibacter ruber TaxID=1750599 RepID=A0A2T0WFM7_9BACT|nr:hypothetical protein CLW00_11292 [Mongoliibacter ruber]
MKVDPSCACSYSVCADFLEAIPLSRLILLLEIILTASKSKIDFLIMDLIAKAHFYN